MLVKYLQVRLEGHQHNLTLYNDPFWCALAFCVNIEIG
jgi:hypothetical protein